MIKIGFRLLFCIVAVTPVLGDYTEDCTKCTDVKAVQDFDATRFGGVWYEVRRFRPRPGYEGFCGLAKYTLNPDGSIKLQLGRIDELTGKPIENTGLLTRAGGETEGAMNVKIPEQPNQLYTIFSIDYDKYFGVHVCVDGKDYVWIHAREPEVDDSELEDVFAEMDKYPTLDPELLKTTNQDC